MEKENKTINRGIMQGWTVISAILFVAYVLEVVKGHRTIGYFTVFALLLTVPLVITWVIFKKRPASEKIKYFCAIFYGILYVFVLLTGATPMVFSYSLPVLYVLMLSNDKVLLRWLAVGNISANIISIAVQIIIDHKSPDEYMTDWEIQMAAAILCSIFACLACSISSKLHTARMQELKESEERLGNLFSKVTEVTGVVDKDTRQLIEKFAEIRFASGRTASAMDEIVEGSSQSTKMVERQLHMTSDIQTVIEHTGELTERISRNVTQTNKKVDTGIENMRKLSESAKSVDKNNKQMLEQMGMLKKTALKVQGIVEMISEIAGQTNLLALNASIEAARAGDAGRGFVVVAEEINDLANQTKESAQNIARMVGALRDKMEETLGSVTDMAQLNEQQNSIIFETEADYDLIRSAVSEVKRDTDDEKEQIEKLLLANSQIVESVQTISAVSEEVMANTAQTQEVTEQNERAVTEMNALAEELVRRVTELRSYISDVE